jgi:hypothetical protein
MSIAKSIAGYIISFLFVLSLYLAITSYTIGSLIQKENIKGFVETQMVGEVASKTCEDFCKGDFDVQKCQEYCNYLDTQEHISQCKDACTNNSRQDEARQECVGRCLTTGMSNESKQRVFQTIDDVYSKKMIAGTSLDDIMPIFKNFILMIVLSLIFGFSLFLVSEKPVSKIGNDLVVVAISMLAIAVIPVFIIAPDVPIIKMVTDYVLEGLYRQIIIGIIILVTGIVIIAIGKKKNK